MWTRAELKDKAKIAFKKNYWTSVLAAAIIGFFAGGGGGSASGRGSANHNVDMNQYDPATVWQIIIGVLLVIAFVTVVMIVIKVVVGNALIVGAQKAFILNEKSEDHVDVKEIAFVFKSGQWGNVAMTLFVKDIFVFLWSLLLIIPGIIKAYEYRMIPYLLAEDPSMSRDEAFARSKEMMDGQKMNAFVLDLSFIPWTLLAVITCGIAGIFYVWPYIHQTNAELYLKLKNN